MQKQTTKQKGDSYEAFVAKVYENILKAQNVAGKIAPIQLEKKKTIPCKSGATAEFDIYWEFSVAEITIKTAIECKDYNSTISVDKMRDFVFKLKDVGNVNGIFISKKGFQKGAKKIAEHEGVTLIKLRELEDKDWDECIKTVQINVHILNPVQLTKISPRVNKEWGQKNNLSAGSSIDLNDQLENIIIKDNSGFKKSLTDIVNEDFSTEENKALTWSKLLSGGSIESGTQTFMIDELIIEYIRPSPTIQTIKIDLTEFALAVLEYVGKTEGKYIVTKDGDKKPI